MVEANASMSSQASSASNKSTATSLDDYIMGNVLGQGAFGRVMEATEKVTGRKVAIKEVNKNQIQ